MKLGMLDVIQEYISFALPEGNLPVFPRLQNNFRFSLYVNLSPSV